MSEVSSTLPHYRLSFSVGGLFLREAAVAAPLHVRGLDWAAVRAEIESNNLLQTRTTTSGQRMSRELVQRLGELTHDEVQLLVDATARERAHLMWIAACRRYALIGEFGEEVVREQFLLMTPDLGHEEFDAFIRQKALWHTELTELADSTYRKLRSNLFAMLREAELLSADGRIVHSIPSARVTAALGARATADLRFFPMTDADLERATA